MIMTGRVGFAAENARVRLRARRLGRTDGVPGQLGIRRPAAAGLVIQHISQVVARTAAIEEVMRDAAATDPRCGSCRGKTTSAAISPSRLSRELLGPA
jgi:hypothetical protein